jgi:hypothetical protein
MANPWRDVYPSKFWDQLVDQYRSGALKSSSATVGRWMRSMFETGRVLPQQIDRITQTLSTYHAIPKDDEQTFTQRISLLRSIHVASVEYCNKYKINKTIKTERTAVDTFTSMDAYVWSIGRRAMRKAGYLEEIQKFCRTDLSDPRSMLRYLTDTRHVVDQFQHLQVGCRMEKMDPYHRSFEIHIGEDGKIPGSEFLTSPMTIAFGQWINAMKDNGNFNAVDTKKLSVPTKPFFVWLETHPLTTGVESGITWAPGQTWHRTDIGAKDTKSVKYRDTLTDVGEWWHWLFPSSAGVVSKVDFKSLKTTPFNTKDGKGKRGERFNSYAYVWEREGTLLAGKHEGNRVHHSSFMAGESVRCAGMIAVNDAGKVTFVSNNSGHYRPTKAQLIDFVKWLNQRGVMADNALVGVEGEEEKVAVAALLTKSNRRPSVQEVNQNLLDFQTKNQKLLDYGL